MFLVPFIGTFAARRSRVEVLREINWNDRTLKPGKTLPPFLLFVFSQSRWMTRFLTALYFLFLGIYTRWWTVVVSWQSPRTTEMKIQPAWWPFLPAIRWRSFALGQQRWRSVTPCFWWGLPPNPTKLNCSVCTAVLPSVGCVGHCSSFWWKWRLCQFKVSVQVSPTWTLVKLRVKLFTIDFQCKMKILSWLTNDVSTFLNTWNSLT